MGARSGLTHSICNYLKTTDKPHRRCMGRLSSGELSFMSKLHLQHRWRHIEGDRCVTQLPTHCSAINKLKSGDTKKKRHKTNQHSGITWIYSCHLPTSKAPKRYISILLLLVMSFRKWNFSACVGRLKLHLALLCSPMRKDINGMMRAHTWKADVMGIH